MSGPLMTKAQERATNPALTAWVAASAGTGKTHVLTARVLRLMVTGTHPERILCLTFTKAAAAEMKSRIFAELGEWTRLTDAELAGRILVRTGERADADMLARVRWLFALVLDLPGGLKIMTFHSFCQSLLGRFPLEAGIAPGFEGMEEALAGEVMAGARDEMLARTRLKHEVALRDALDTVAARVTENTFDEVIGDLAFYGPLMARSMAAYGSADGMVAALRRSLGLSPDDTAEKIRASACAPAAMDEAGLRALAAAMMEGSASEADRARPLADFLAAEGAERDALFDAHTLVFLTQKYEPRKTVANKPTLTANPAFAEVIAKETARLLFVRERLTAATVAETTAALLALGAAMLDTYSAVKAERGLIDFDDMIQRSVQLLENEGIAAWILFKLDGEIDHILVDEAQDTNRDQWSVVEAVANEFFSGAGARDVQRTVFAVGDDKQSIFSFQRADPREFIEARNRLFTRAEGAEAATDTVPLDRSFRSGEAVLALVDAVFHDEAPARIGLTATGASVRHDFSRKGAGGLVELWPLEVPRGSEDGAAQAWAPPLVQEEVDDAAQRSAWRIARRIRDMIRKGETLVSKARPITAGDILILVRKRGAIADHLVRALKRLQVPVAGRDRMVLTEELPVMDLMALGRAVLQPGDDLTLATVLKSPFIGTSEQSLYDLAYGRGEMNLWASLAARAHERDDWKAAYGWLLQALNAADHLTPFDFMNRILGPLGGREKLAARLGADIHDPVDAFMAEALAYERTAAPSLLGFLTHVERAGAEVKRDMEAAGGAVRVMTCHGAKGLQAPIVFLTDLTSLPDISKDGRILDFAPEDGGAPLLMWSKEGATLPLVTRLKGELKAKAIAEYRRLLYVALTRAEDRLYVAGWQGKKAAGDDSWFAAIEEGFKRLGALEADGPDGLKVLRHEVQQTAEVKAAAADEASRTAVPAPAWLHAAAPSEPVPPRPLAPSRPDDDEPAAASPLAARAARRFARGKLVHALLEWLPEMDAADRQAAAARYLAEPAHGLTAEEQAALAREVDAILNDPVFAPLFGPGSRAEVPVAGVIGGRALAGQVDRLVAIGNQILIVDYKTNRPPPLAVEGVAPLYMKQMALYRAALKALHPGMRIRAALLWTDGARLMELPEERLEEALVELMASGRNDGITSA